MRRIVVVVFSLLFLFGCQKREVDVNQTDVLYNNYKAYYHSVSSQNDFMESCDDFSIRLITNLTNKQNIRYDVIIDNPAQSLTRIQAIAMVENEDQYNPVSIGILEDEEFALMPGVIDKQRGIYKGINLSGMTKLKDFRVRIYITYIKNDEFTERYLILDGHAS